MKRFMKPITAILLLLGMSGCAQKALVISDVRNTIDSRCLGMAFNDFLKPMSYDEIQKSDGCCWGVKRQGELLFILYDKQGLSDLIVRNIEIVSPEISFSNEIHIGMTIGNLLKIYPDMELMIDENDYKTEYFSPPELFSYKPDGSLDSVVVFEVVSDTGKPLSNDENYPTGVYDKAGHISKISVFKW